MPTILPSSGRALRGAVGLAIGQSLGLHYIQGGFASLAEELRARAVSRTIRSFLPLNGAMSGRFSCRSIYEADGGGPNLTAYWWDDVEGAPGQLITGLIPTILALGQPLDFVIWNQGQADGEALAGNKVGMTKAQAWTARYNAVGNIIASFRDLLSLPDLPFFLDEPPNTGPTRRRAYELIRQMDFTRIRSTPNVYRGATTWDLPTQDGTHLNANGASEMGRRTGHKIAGAVFGATSYYRGPYVASVTKLSNTQTRVLINTDAGDTLVKPASVPMGWRVEDKSAYGVNLPISSVTWSSNTATLTHAACAGDPAFFVSYDGPRGYTNPAANWVGGSVSRMPLQGFDLFWSGPN